MNLIKKIFVVLFLSVVIFTAQGTESADSLRENYGYRLENDFAKELQSDVESDKVSLADSITNKEEVKDKDYWKRQLRKFKFDMNDPTIPYPKFINFCLKAYRWANKAFNSYDSEYVVGTGKKCRLMLKNENWLEGYDHRIKNENINILMASKLSSTIGLSVSYMALSVGYTFDLDNLWGRQNSRKRFEFEFSCARFAAFAYYRKTEGTVDVGQFGLIGKKNKVQVPFDGLKKQSYGFDVRYYFNNKKYSHGAAYSYSKYQKKSAGTFTAGVSISHQEIDIDYVKLPPPMITQLEGQPLKYKINYNDYDISIGYCYNWVFAKNWLLNITLEPYVGIKYNLHDSTEAARRGRVSMNFKCRQAIVHNVKNFYYGLTGYFDAHWYNGPSNEMENMYGNLGINIGFRFL